MKRYNIGDMATFYFIIRKNKNKDSIIQAWTDVKALAEFYIDFHKCPAYSVRKITDRIETINNMIDDYYYNEISIANIYMRSKSNRCSKKNITLPLTSSELLTIQDSCDTFGSDIIDYANMNEMIPYLKNKYQKALNNIFLSAIIRRVIHNKPEKITQLIDFDQLAILTRMFPSEFGI